MSAQYSNALHARLRNQSLEIKRLQAEIEEVKQAHEQALAQMEDERKSFSGLLEKAQKMTKFYKGKFLLLKREVEGHLQ